MTAACEICGQIITGREVPAIGLSDEQKQIQALQNFDLLASAMTHHLSLVHQRETGGEMTAVAHIATKVYAMTWATSSVQHFEELRTAWRSSLVSALLTKHKPFQTDAAAAAPSGAGGGCNSPNGSESKEMKSERNSST